MSRSTNKPPRHWLTAEQIIRIHAEQLVIFGGPPGLRDRGMLESAVERTKNKRADGEDDPTVIAAAYGFGLAKNHPFVDGNKRIAFAATIVFLARNGIETDWPQPETVQVLMDLAAGKLTEAELAVWIARHC